MIEIISDAVFALFTILSTMLTAKLCMTIWQRKTFKREEKQNHG